MTTFIFAVIAWFFLGKIVYDKQYKAALKYEADSNAQLSAWFAAILAPFTVILYAIRAIFFEDWY